MRDLFTRSPNNPILKPDPAHPWESRKLYNPGAAVDKEGLVHLFYRAMGSGQDWHSALGHAVFDRDKLVKRYPEPALDRDPNNPLELRGLEDPRITRMGNTFHMAYAVYDGKTSRLHIATSTNLKSWEKHGQAFADFNFFREGGILTSWKDGKPVHWDHPKSDRTGDLSKAGAIFPERIRGKYWMLFNEYRIWLANSDDGIHWNYLPGPFLGPHKGSDLFDNIFVEAGPPPIKTEKGWLVLYHGVNDAIQYHLGILLLDLEDPTKVLWRSEEPIFGPRDKLELSGIVDIISGVRKLIEQGKEDELKELLKDAEREGFMPQVVFCPGAVVLGDELWLYYGASDMVVCAAHAPLADVLALLP